MAQLLRLIVLAVTLAVVTTTLGPQTPIVTAVSGAAGNTDVRPSDKSTSNDNSDSNDNNDNQASRARGLSDGSAPTVPFVGVWTDGSPSQVPRLDQLGVGWARTLALWSAIEPAKDTFNWADLDAQIDAASGGGKRQILVMVRNNPAWAADSRCKVTTGGERANLADFMTALVNRYKDRVKYWQLYNEMNNTSEAFDKQYDLGGCFGTASGTTPTQEGRDNYARMLDTVGTAIHEADPDAQVVSGAVMSGNSIGPACPTCLFDVDFARGMLSSLKNRGALDQLDYVAVHFYSSQHDAYDAYGPDLLGRVNKLRQDMRDAGLGEKRLKPIIVDEGSYTGSVGRSTSDPNDAFNRAQQYYVVKALTRAAAADVIYFWFWLHDVRGGGLGTENAYGLLTVDGTPKPAYTTFRYFTTIVGRADRDVVPVDTKTPKLEGYEFALPDDLHLQIVWNKADSQQVAFRPEGRLMWVSNPIGTQLAANGGVVAVGDEPRFIFLRR